MIKFFYERDPETNDRLILGRTIDAHIMCLLMYIGILILFPVIWSHFIYIFIMTIVCSIFVGNNFKFKQRNKKNAR